MSVHPTSETLPRPTPVDAAPRGRTRQRADIQALRALAVTLVVLFHFWPGRMPGGYIGVDVFFVISGFLITSHLLREVEATGTVALGRFWARRARRLLPAAYLVIAACVVVTLVAIPHTDWAQWFRELTGATLYVENWVLAGDAVNYLAADNAPSPVQHYWSLSAEEQFYLVWPLLVLGAAFVARRRIAGRRRVIAVVLGVATVASFVFSLYDTTHDPSAAYFVTPVRAWQFGAGALLALWAGRSGPGRRTAPAAVRSLAAWAGYAVIVLGGIALFDSSTPFPGTAALVPVVAVMAVIWADEPDHRFSPHALVGLRPVGYLGDISYSLYLWHWPPLIILPVLLGHELGLPARVTLLAAVVLVAAASKRYVEDRTRFTHRFGLQRTGVALGATAVVAALLAATCLAGTAAVHRETERASVTAQEYLEDPPDCFGAASMDREHPCTNEDLAGVLVPAPEAVSSDFADYPGCWVDVDESTLKKGCTFGAVDDPDVPHVILVGDSHARALLPAFVTLAQEGKISLTAQLKATCAWTTGKLDYDDPERSRTCEQWKAQLEPWLVSQAKTTDLIVTTGYLKTISGDAQQRVDDMAAAWKPLADRGVPIVGIADNPVHSYLPYKCLEKLDHVEPDSCAVSQKKAFPFPDPYKATPKVVDGAKTLDLTDFYCRDGICPSIIGGVDVYRDNSHMTTTFTKTLTPYIWRGLQRLDVLH